MTQTDFTFNAPDAKLMAEQTAVGRLYRYLKSGHSITALQSWRHLGIMRLAPRIFDLRCMGYTITKEMITVNNQYNEPCNVARYTLGE